MNFIKKIKLFFENFKQKRKQGKVKKLELKIQKLSNNQPMDSSCADNKKIKQYSKCLVTALTIAACLWISMSYLLSTVALIMFGNAEPLSSLSEKVCEVIIGVVIAYSCKSFSESFAEAKHDLDVMKIKESIGYGGIGNEPVDNINLSEEA